MIVKSFRYRPEGFFNGINLFKHFQLQQMQIKTIPKYLTQHFSDETCEISYQWTANTNHIKPVVVILHALTGNSTVSGTNGWWQEIVGKNKTIDTNKYRVLSIDTLGNGFVTDTHLHIHSVENITVNDVA